MKTSTVLIVAGVGVGVYLLTRPPKVVVAAPTGDPLRAAGGELIKNAGNALIGAIFGGGKKETPKEPTAGATAPTGGSDGENSAPILDWGPFHL